jgi:hypothetical protein
VLGADLSVALLRNHVRLRVRATLVVAGGVSKIRLAFLPMVCPEVRLLGRLKSENG